ncbi:MAG: hypothetical protein H8E44_00570, partial [Planctomycetes bacterium]|nr:hypothetical protein [Planctomycetota bacterium]
MSKRKPPRPSVHRLPTKLVESAGHRYLEQLLEPPEVDPHPDEIRLREWLSSDLIEGKFTRHWHRNIALAKELRIELSPFWDALASLLDRVFPRTCNVFNPFDPRDPVTEELLYPHLEKSHGLSLGECKKLRLDQLVCLLQQDVEGGPDRILDDEGPPDELLANLTKLERRMVEFV